MFSIFTLYIQIFTHVVTGRGHSTGLSCIEISVLGEELLDGGVGQLGQQVLGDAEHEGEVLHPPRAPHHRQHRAPLRPRPLELGAQRDLLRPAAHHPPDGAEPGLAGLGAQEAHGAGVAEGDGDPVPGVVPDDVLHEAAPRAPALQLHPAQVHQRHRGLALPAEGDAVEHRLLRGGEQQVAAVRGPGGRRHPAPAAAHGPAVRGPGGGQRVPHPEHGARARHQQPLGVAAPAQQRGPAPARPGHGVALPRLDAPHVHPGVGGAAGGQQAAAARPLDLGDGGVAGADQAHQAAAAGAGHQAARVHRPHRHARLHQSEENIRIT